MPDNRTKIPFIFIILFISFLDSLIIIPVSAEEIAVAMVSGIRKELKVIHKGREINGIVGMDLFEGDILKTGSGCQAVIILGDGSEMTLNQNTEIIIKAYNSKNKSIFVKLGEIFAKFLPQKTKVVFETPQGVAGIEGTEFSLKVDNNESQVSVSEGAVSVGDADDSKRVKVTQDYECNFKRNNVAPPRRFTQQPEWVREIVAYGQTMAKISKRMEEFKGNGDFKGMGEERIKELISEKEIQNKELQNVKTPARYVEIHSNIIKINEKILDVLKSALVIKENPGNRKAMQEYLITVRQTKKEIFDFLREISSRNENWSKRVEIFKKRYSEKQSAR